MPTQERDSRLVGGVLVSGGGRFARSIGLPGNKLEKRLEQFCLPCDKKDSCPVNLDERSEYMKRDLCMIGTQNGVRGDITAEGFSPYS